MVTKRKNPISSEMKSQKNLAQQIHVYICRDKNKKDDTKKCMNEGVQKETAWECLTNDPGLCVWRQLAYDVFMWVGKHSSADEYRTAAFKMAELDLKDKAVQHRECQSSESSKFTNLFPTLTLLKGGVESGIKLIEKEKPQPKLFHISGDKIMLKQQKCIKDEQISYRKNNLTADDVFIIDLGEKLYQVNGKNSSKDQKFRGATIISQIKSSRGKVIAEIIDGYTIETHHPVIDSMPVKEKATHVKMNVSKREKSLWKLSDESGQIEMSKVASGEISKSLFCSKDGNYNRIHIVFIFDAVETIYVWVGKETSKNEKMCSMSYAQKYGENINEPNLPLVKIFEGSETEQMIIQLK
ncbi:LOW QUALITY PROTEIN: hypothetical protein MXB_2698 [Myxobolus squamalis]|nr:LOW QUALITY PROTEIN: hypothetical protein MXB_2698 [Myxobolus squamalis]